MKGIYYASPSSEDSYRDRQLTTNFEFWIEIFLCADVFSYEDSKTVSVRTPRNKSPWLVCMVSRICKDIVTQKMGNFNDDSREIRLFFGHVVKTTYLYQQNWLQEDSMCHYCIRLNTNVSIAKSSLMWNSFFELWVCDFVLAYARIMYIFAPLKLYLLQIEIQTHTHQKFLTLLWGIKFF